HLSWSVRRVLRSRDRFHGSCPRRLHMRLVAFYGQGEVVLLFSFSRCAQQSVGPGLAPAQQELKGNRRSTLLVGGPLLLGQQAAEAQTREPVHQLCHGLFRQDDFLCGGGEQPSCGFLLIRGVLGGEIV